MCVSTRKAIPCTGIPSVLLRTAQFPSFNRNLFFSQKRVPTPSFPFRGNLGDQVKGRSKKKAKIVDRVTICSTPESTVSKLQYEPFLFSVA